MTTITLSPRQCRHVITYGTAVACGYGIQQHCITGCSLDQGKTECSLFRMKIMPKKKSKHYKD